MSGEELRIWLAANGLEQHGALFEENDVDLATLRILSDADLQELGLSFGARKRIRHALGGATTSAAGADVAPGTGAVVSGVSEPSGKTPDEERRQLTVMFCDMVSFTELATRVDPEVLREVIRRYEDVCAACITRYDGYVFQRLGDGIVAFFGFPLAHEGEAERAVRAALEIVDRLSTTEVPEIGRVRVRIGIATGVVVVSTSGTSAVGETMNLASRLQGLAGIGEIVVSERVYRHAGGAFDYTDIGTHALKGIAKPTQAWRVNGERREVTRFEASRRSVSGEMIGRAIELGMLQRAWDEARTVRGQLVMLSGEAGIGKSRTVMTSCEQLAQSGARILRLQCSPFNVNSAFQPIADLLARLMGFERGESSADRFDRLHQFVVGRLQRPESDVPFLAAMLSLDWRARYQGPALSPRRVREEGIRVLVALFKAIGEREPTVFLFEDAHWADPSTVDVLSAVVEALDAPGMFWLLTTRPEFTARWTPATTVRAIHLQRLEASESRTMVERITAAKPLPSALVDQIVRKADGVPLFVEELTFAVMESGELRDEGDHYALQGAVQNVTLPETLRDSLMARLDRSGAVKQVAQIGSAIGREFPYDILAAVSPMTPPALDEALQRMTAAGLAFQYGEIPEARFTFKHALLQDAAYDSMLKSTRQTLHRSIAGALLSRTPELCETEPDVLARHYAAAGMHTEAVPLWRQAGDGAMQRVAYPEAIAHWRTGLAGVGELADQQERLRLELALRTRLGPAEVALRGWAAQQVKEVLEPAWVINQTLDDHESSMPLLHSLWVHLMTGAHLETSLEWAERMLSEGRRIQDERLVICGHRAAATTYFWMGRFEDAKRHGDEVIRRYDPAAHGTIAARTNSDPLTGDGIYRAHYLWMLGYPDQAREVSRSTAVHARERHHPFDVAFSLTLGAQSFDYCGDAATLLACADEATRIGRDFGVPLMSEMMAEISRGKSWLLQGRLEDGAGLLRASVERLAGTGHRVWIAHLMASVGFAYARQGALEESLTLIDDSLQRDDCREDRAHLAETLRLKGEVLIAMGRHTQAVATLHTSLGVARGQRARGWELRTATSLARHYAADGDFDSARRTLGPVHAWFTEGFDTVDWQTADAMMSALRGETDIAPHLVGPFTTLTAQ